MKTNVCLRGNDKCSLMEACRAVGIALVLGSGGQRFKPHCSQHVVVSLGKTLHPKLLLWGLSTVLSM